MLDSRADLPIPAARVMIADDHAGARFGLAQLVGAHGWEVCAEASDGREAVARVNEVHPDLLIMECALPGLNGMQVVREIERSAAGTEVLLIVSIRSPHTLRQIYRCPARGCLLQTEAVEELIPALEAIRRHHTFRSRGLSELYGQVLTAKSEIEPLTAREQEVLELIANGLLSKEIADKFRVSEKTICHHRDSLKHKLRARTTGDMICQAIRFGLVEV